MENVGTNSMVTKAAKDKKRFVYLDIIKFLMSLIIVIYHYNYFCMDNSSLYLFRGGYLAVEVFFVISGFLFYRFEIESKDRYIGGKRIFSCMKHKVAGLYPAYIFSLLTAFGIDIAAKINNMTVTDFLKSCFRFGSDALLIGEWGIPKIKQTYNIVTWYISAMLFACIVWLLLFKYIKVRSSYMILTLTILLYGYLGLQAGNLHVHGNRTYILLTDGALRGIAGMGAGFLAYYLYKKLGSLNAVYIKMIYFISFAGTVLVLFLAKDSYTDFVMIPCAMLLAASASTLSSDNEKISKAAAFLGKFSYFIYLNHLIVLDIMKHIMKEYSVLLYCCIVLLYSYLIMNVVNILVKKVKRK